MNPIDRSIVLDEARRYTDSQRIAYIEPGKVVLPETTVSIKKQSDGNVGIIGGLESPVMVGIEEGKRYALSVDGLLYYCTPLIEKEGDYEIRYIYTTMDTTDEAFLLLTEVYENGVPLEYVTQVTASVAGDRTILLSTTETIHPIDPKFLPGVCLPVVELTVDEFIELADYGNDGKKLTDGALFEQLEAASKTKAPVVFKIGDVGSCVASYMNNETEEATHNYVATFGSEYLDNLTVLAAVYSPALSIWAVADITPEA